jgi:hypothetical protein
MNPKVKEVRAMADYRLELTFVNGERRVFDASPYLQYPVFQPLRNAGLFSRAHVVAGSIEWPGEVDLSYDTLYLESVPVEMAEPVAG